MPPRPRPSRRLRFVAALAFAAALPFITPPSLAAQIPPPAEMPPSSFERWRPPEGLAAPEGASLSLGAPAVASTAAPAIAMAPASLGEVQALLDAAAPPAAASAQGQVPAIPQGQQAVAPSQLPAAAPAGETFGIAMPWGEESFESFRSAYLSEDGRKWLAAIMARSKPYMAFIAERLRWYNLPDELAFLPVIESEFSPKAVSKSGATGLWQFMKNSIGGYGIRIDDWVDERRDFMKSTDAALRKLADNYAAFGDWNLALAAYNSGSGAVARAVKRADASKPQGYWSLRDQGLLSRETTSYVPKFLAVASILSYPRRNGIEAAWESPASWEALEANRSVDLCLLAEAANLPLAALKSANAELRYTVTPPYSGYRIKVPAESAPAVRAALENPSLKLLRYYLHTVRSGDTLSAIARHYGTPLAMIVEANPGMRADFLRLGQVIVVPAMKDSGPMPVAAAAEDATLDFSASYTVVKGDTLWSISLRYEVQPEVLAEKNGLGLSSVIREGMVLRVPILK